MFSAKIIPEVSRSEGSSRTLAARCDGLKALGLAALLNAFLFGLFFAVATPGYETNDDRGMQMIASGFFTGQPSEYLVFTSFLIGWPLRIFYSLWPGCNWYFAYLVAAHYAALTAVAFLVLSRRPGWLFGLLYVGFFLVVETRILLELQFTTTAFLAGTGGLLLVVDGFQPGRGPRWLQVIAGFAFTALMIMIREQVAPMLVLIALPFLIERFGLAGWRRLLGVGLVGAALFLALQGVNRWYYVRDPAWAEYREYNNLRGKIHRTALNAQLQEAGPGVGWSQNDIYMFDNWYFAEPEVYGSISRMRVLVNKLQRITKPEQIFRRLSKVYLWPPKVWGVDTGHLMALAMVNGAWCLLVAGSQRRRCFWGLLASCGVFVLLSAYLRDTTRLPERVSYNMPLFLHVIYLYWASGFHALPAAVSSPNVLNRLVPTFARLAVLRWATLALVLGCVVLYVSYDLGESVWYANAANRRLKAMSRKIFEPVRTLLPPSHKPILVPFPYDSFLEQSVSFYPRREKVPFYLVPAYGWLTHSPFFRQMLDEHQLRPYSLSLVDRRDVFFLMERKWLGPLQTFYREHYGLEIRFDMVLNTDEMPEYRECRLYLYQAHAVHPTAGVYPSREPFRFPGCAGLSNFCKLIGHRSTSPHPIQGMSGLVRKFKHAPFCCFDHHSSGVSARSAGASNCFSGLEGCPKLPKRPSLARNSTGGTHSAIHRLEKHSFPETLIVISSKEQSTNALSGLGPGAVGIAASLTRAVAPASLGTKRNPHLYHEERTDLRDVEAGVDEVIRTVSSISVVVPVYNSESILPALINRLEPVLGSVCDEYEVVLVNDGSRDGSWEVIQKLAAQHGWVRGINLMRNYGQHNALLCGIRSARGEVIVTMDDDLQNPPEEIPHMLSRLEQGYDVVYGTPQKEQHGLWRDVASKITKMALQSASGAEVAGKASAFRVFRASLSEAFANSRSSYISIDVLLTWGTTRFTAVPVAHNPRQAGLSNYTFRKLVTHALNMTTGYSTAPLRLASLVGFGFTLFGMAVLAFVLFRCFISGCSVQGFTFLASVISIFSGAQLFALGIVGEYLARMHVRSMDRPPYTIRQQL